MEIWTDIAVTNTEFVIHNTQNKIRNFERNIEHFIKTLIGNGVYGEHNSHLYCIYLKFLHIKIVNLLLSFYCIFGFHFISPIIYC